MASVHYKEFIQEEEDKGIVYQIKELILHSKGSQLNAQEEYQRADWWYSVQRHRNEEKKKKGDELVEV